MPFPRRHDTHVLEQKSETFLRNKLPQDWVINRLQNDYGVDFLIGITENGELRGLELIIQLKASGRSSGHGNTESIKLKISTYRYLRNLLSVVMVVKYVESENEAYWQFLREISPPTNHGQRSFTVHIPKVQKLSTIHWEETAALVKRITDLKLGALNG